MFQRPCRHDDGVAFCDHFCGKSQDPPPKYRRLIVLFAVAFKSGDCCVARLVRAVGDAALYFHSDLFVGKRKIKTPPPFWVKM